MHYHFISDAFLRCTIKLYPSLDSIIILNARTLAFVRALAFWEAFPGAIHANQIIKCLTIDPGMKLVRGCVGLAAFRSDLMRVSQIVASMGARVATWAMSGVQSDTWRVHSSLLLPEGRDVTTLDCKSGTSNDCDRRGYPNLFKDYWLSVHHPSYLSIPLSWRTIYRLGPRNGLSRALCI